MSPDMIIIPHILLDVGEKIKVHTPQGEIVAVVKELKDGVLVVDCEGAPYLFHGGFFVKDEEGFYIPYYF